MPQPDDSFSLAREQLLKARIYRFFAICFAVTGIVIFLVLFFQQTDGDFNNILASPRILVILILPFLPAIVLSGMSRRAEKKVMKIMNDKKSS